MEANRTDTVQDKGFEGIQGAVECKNCHQPIIPGGVWAGTYWSGWEHFWTHRQMCTTGKGDQMRPITVNGLYLSAEPKEEKDE